LRLIRAASTAVLVSLALVGCGGTDVSSNPLSTANETAPTATISGTPATSTTVGTYYSFTPSASDSDGGKLTYSVTNPPAWASFNTATGQLSGTPKSTDTGTTFNVVISVADGAAHASLPAFSLTVTAAGSTSTSGTATLSWTAPTQNSDGSGISDLAGYNIHYGNSSAAMNQTIQVANAGATGYVITGLPSGTWYFTVTSYTTGGAESAPSAVASKTIS